MKETILLICLTYGLFSGKGVMEKTIISIHPSVERPMPAVAFNHFNDNSRSLAVELIAAAGVNSVKGLSSAVTANLLDSCKGADFSKNGHSLFCTNRLNSGFSLMADLVFEQPNTIKKNSALNFQNQ